MTKPLVQITLLVHNPSAHTRQAIGALWTPGTPISWLANVSYLIQPGLSLSIGLEQAIQSGNNSGREDLPGA